MAAGKELRERFAEKDSSAPDASAVAEMLGITAINMANTVTDDVEAMIKQGHRKSLEGYVLCLSRIIRHANAWVYIEEAFKRTGESIPGKYYALFGKTRDSTSPVKKGMVVE